MPSLIIINDPPTAPSGSTTACAWPRWSKIRFTSEVDIQIQSAAKALDQRDGAGLGAGAHSTMWSSLYQPSWPILNTPCMDSLSIVFSCPGDPIPRYSP